MIRILFSILLLSAAAGCTNTVVVSPASNGRAFIVRGDASDSYVYSCRIENSEPVCRQVREVP